MFSPKIIVDIMELLLASQQFLDALDPILARAQFTVYTYPQL